MAYWKINNQYTDTSKIPKSSMTPQRDFTRLRNFFVLINFLLEIYKY